jgi:hypothetical protein
MFRPDGAILRYIRIHSHLFLAERGMVIFEMEIYLFSFGIDHKTSVPAVPLKLFQGLNKNRQTWQNVTRRYRDSMSDYVAEDPAINFKYSI